MIYITTQKGTLHDYLLNFQLDKHLSCSSEEENIKNHSTLFDLVEIENSRVPRYTNEFWTSKQRQSSYRGCFKAQLPNFFVKLLSNPTDTIYDPFSGRGTTVLESALVGRNIISNDVNPLSALLVKPRFFLPSFDAVKERLASIHLSSNNHANIDLSMFYHPKTEAEIVSLQKYLSERSKEKKEDHLDQWIRMVATNRLTGHSKGFFSVYTLPPNQAASQERQKTINKSKNQNPPYKDVKELILVKTKSLLRNVKEEEKINLLNAGKEGLFLSQDVRNTPEIEDTSVDLIVTSPPFLDTVQYSKDNWLRCWFNNIDKEEVQKKITVLKKLEDWTNFIEKAFQEFHRILKLGAFVCFEVGEVRKKTINLDEHIIPIGEKTGFTTEGIVINSQKFTKTSNIWGIGNNSYGTNTNRIVILKKEL